MLVRVTSDDASPLGLPRGRIADPPEPVLSAVVVSVPEAQPVVGAPRARDDRSGRWGVPAHVTVLFPFVAPAEQDEQTYAALRADVLAGRREPGTWRIVHEARLGAAAR